MWKNKKESFADIIIELQGSEDLGVFADRLGVTNNAVKSWKSGNLPNLSSMYRIGRNLNWNDDEMLRAEIARTRSKRIVKTTDPAIILRMINAKYDKLMGRKSTVSDWDFSDKLVMWYRREIGVKV